MLKVNKSILNARDFKKKAQLNCCAVYLKNYQYVYSTRSSYVKKLSKTTSLLDFA